MLIAQYHNILRVQNVKYLGLIFDKVLSWNNTLVMTYETT